MEANRMLTKKTPMRLYRTICLSDYHQIINIITELMNRKRTCTLTYM